MIYFFFIFLCNSRHWASRGSLVFMVVCASGDISESLGPWKLYSSKRNTRTKERKLLQDTSLLLEENASVPNAFVRPRLKNDSTAKRLCASSFPPDANNVPRPLQSITTNILVWRCSLLAARSLCAGVRRRDSSDLGLWGTDGQTSQTRKKTTTKIRFYSSVSSQHRESVLW